MSVLVSVNCMAYNHEKYIADAIESFLMQKTNFKFEILIGEDCSTDQTRKIVDEYVKQNPEKIRLITSESNVGVSENDQRLTENSKGKYIAVCEGDDYWTDPYKLQKQVDYMEANPACTLCFHAAEIVRAPKQITRRIVKPYQESRVSPIEDIIKRGGGFCPTASLFYPRKLIENPPDFYLNGHVGDYPIQMYLASKGYAYYINDYMSVYRTGVEGSWTSNLHSIGNRREKMIEVYKGDIELLQDFNDFTNSKYAYAVRHTIQKKEIAMRLLQRVRKRSKNQQSISNLRFVDRLKIYSFHYLPKSYDKLAEMRDFFNR